MENLHMEMPKYDIEQLEGMIAECQKKLAFAHRLLMEDEVPEQEQRQLEAEMKELNNTIFLYQSQLRKRYTEEFSKAGQQE